MTRSRRLLLGLLVTLAFAWSMAGAAATPSAVASVPAMTGAPTSTAGTASPKAPPAAASGVVFGAPVATGDFGSPVVFSTTFRSERPPLRVELLAHTTGEHEDRVSTAAVEAVGDEWRATVISGGHIVPDTRWQFRFRVITDAGVSVGPLATYRLRDTGHDWQILPGERVNVWWYEGGRDFAARAQAIAEDAIDRASTLLGVTTVAPVDFLIYADTQAFRVAMGPDTRENVGGQAHPAIRTLFGLIEPRQIDSDWVDELVSHELAHIVFHDAVDNPYQYPPRWLNEGFSVYLSRGDSDRDRQAVAAAAGAGTLMPLEALGGQFPTRPLRQSLAYSESVSAVAYLVDTYGEGVLAQLAASFRVGLGLDQAFRDATGSGFEAFDRAWLASVGAELPAPYGPTPSQPGPVPDAWATEGAALLR
jgi:hypothetical protein